MNTIDLKRAEFRQYLESTGVMEALSCALIKLYDEHVKPSDPVSFVRTHFKRPEDDGDCAKRIEDSEAAELIRKQQNELEMARQEIVNLRQTLNAMAVNSPTLESLEKVLNTQSTPYQSIFDDTKYEATLVKKYLTENLFESLSEIGDKPSIVDCIVKADELESFPLGVIALNGDCYTKFAELFEPIIKEIHGIDIMDKYPDSDWGDGKIFDSLNNDKIISIEMSCSRSLAGVPFIPGMNEQDLENVLTIVQNAIQSTRTDDDDIDGEFFKITDVKNGEPIFDALQNTGLGFQSMESTEHRLWPIGRGLYINCSRTQSILINEEEHLRFVAKEPNDGFGNVYRGLAAMIQTFGDGLTFDRNEKLGWLTANLHKLGTALICRIKIKLGQNIDCLKETCKKFHIQVSPIELDNKGDEQIVELVNKTTFGISEFECMKMFYDQIKDIIAIIDQTAKTESSNEKETEIKSEDKVKDETAIPEDEKSVGNSAEKENEENPDAAENENSNQLNSEIPEAKNDESNEANESCDSKPNAEINDESTNQINDAESMDIAEQNVPDNVVTNQEDSNQNDENPDQVECQKDPTPPADTAPPDDN